MEIQNKNIPEKEMNSKLNRERVIVHPNSLQKRELPQLGVRVSVRKPTLKDTFIQQIRNPLHRHLSLLLHGLVIVRRDKQFLAALIRIEKATLGDKTIKPVAIREIVIVKVYTHVGGVEGEKRVVEIRRRVIEA
jgi:hypothetical protein